ncbi:hypothetical protein AAEX37_02506 [Oligella sp. MSHR50489EDL]|uniref:hypothetical protein n=1 Tax=Oligella sp. MSHR50489EDL TaxID=3139409 RepID=UPI003D81A559
MSIFYACECLRIIFGEAEGKAENQLEIAQNLKSRGYSLTEIKEITGIPQQLLERLH